MQSSRSGGDVRYRQEGQTTLPDSGKSTRPEKFAHSAVEPHQRAVRSPSAVIVFVLLTAAALAADLLSKHWAFTSLMPPEDQLALRMAELQNHATMNPDIARKLNSREMLHHLNLRRHVCPGMDFVLSANEGAVFGTRLHGSGNVHRLIVGLATIATTALVLYFFGTSHRRARIVHVSMALILAGALGNLYDRLTSCISLPAMEPIRYNVRDFIDCSSIPLPGFRWVWVFNVADVWLVVGVGLLIVYWLGCVLAMRRQTAKQAPAGSKS